MRSPCCRLLPAPISPPGPCPCVPSPLLKEPPEGLCRCFAFSLSRLKWGTGAVGQSSPHLIRPVMAHTGICNETAQEASELWPPSACSVCQRSCQGDSWPLWYCRHCDSERVGHHGRCCVQNRDNLPDAGPCADADDCPRNCGKWSNLPRFATCCASCPGSHTDGCAVRQLVVRKNRRAEASARANRGGSCAHGCHTFTWQRDMGGHLCCTPCTGRGAPTGRRWTPKGCEGDTPPRPGSRLPRDIAGGGTAPGPSATKAGTGLHITSLPFSAEGWRHCGEAIVRSIGGSVARRRPLPSCSQAEVDLGQTCRLLHAWFHTRFDPLFNEAPSTAAEDVATIAEPLKAMTHTSHSTRVVRCSRATPP